MPLPVARAPPGHRVHDLGLPPAAWLNLYPLDPDAGAKAALAPVPGLDFLEAWHLAQTRLAALFGDAGLLARERDRLKHAVVSELQEIADGD